MVRLGVHRHRLCTHHGFEVLLNGKARRTVLLDDRKSSVPLRTKGFHSVRVESAAIRALTDRQVSEVLTVPRVEHYHGLGIVAGYEQHVILGVKPQTSGLASLAV